MKLEILDDSKNYTCQIIKLVATHKLEGLDNLVGASIQGNLCLISKDYPIGDLYLFVQSGSELNDDFLRVNNAYRHSHLNIDPSVKGYFDDSGRVKAIKFKGHKSTGVLFPLSNLAKFGINTLALKAGDEFNSIEGKKFCWKAVIKQKGSASTKPKQMKILDNIVDKRVFPEHFDTDHLLKYIDNLHLEDFISITVKLHGTSGRVANTIVQRKLNWKDRIAKWLGVNVQTEHYDYVVGSRHSLKSVGFNELKNKAHFYSEDLWTSVAKTTFADKLNKGEAVYFEIIGKDYSGKPIQPGYHYNFQGPEVFIYRITNINPQGVEVDLPWPQVRIRAEELGIKTVPNVFYGKLEHYLHSILGNDLHDYLVKLEEHLKKIFLDKPSRYDSSVIEEGICLRVEKYPRPKVYKLKSPLFLIHEGVIMDKGIADIEETQEN
jgi:hypothetical protein